MSQCDDDTHGMKVSKSQGQKKTMHCSSSNEWECDLVHSAVHLNSSLVHCDQDTLRNGARIVTV